MPLPAGSKGPPQIHSFDQKFRIRVGEFKCIGSILRRTIRTSCPLLRDAILFDPRLDRG